MLPPAPAAATVLAHRRRRLPLWVGMALGWLALMLLVALLADVIRPYSITALDLRARLQPRSASGVLGRIRWARTNWGGTCCPA